ncbi:hypothetical protein DFH29DRAFT_1006835 [Suillus ampliporus]|nr:hypothetical protein DFH29DRAFT_1006835 [Suillus ampliporus]
MADIVNTKASDDILVIPVSVQSIILPDKNLSVSSFLQFSLPLASITTALLLCKYFSTDSPPEDSLYLDYLHTQPLPRLVVLHKLLEGPILSWTSKATGDRRKPSSPKINLIQWPYPFDTMMDAGQDVLSYWTHLMKIPEGSILACITEKIYSIKPSSVPKERTMSVFTRMNIPARNCQHVRMLVDMTQIQQWHMYDPKNMVERWHPDISFCDLDSIISSPKQSAARRSHESTGSYLSVGTDEQEEILEDEEDTWLDEMLATKPAEDSAFDIEADANLHTLIVTKALSDEHEESPINGLCSTQGDATEDDADLEGMDNE